MIVVDASALLAVLSRTAVDHLEQRLLDSGQSLHAPHLLDVEITHAIRRQALAGEIGDARGHEMLADLNDFPIERYPHRMFLPRIWELRHNFSAYDALYVALAEELDATLLTRDRRLAAAAGAFVQIELA